MDWKVKDSDVKEVIRRVGASKAPGPDGISNSLLKTCDKDGRLSAILAKITQASFDLGYYPKCWHTTHVIVLLKLRKSINNKKHAGAYRPVTLLDVTGKIVEAILTERISTVVETARVLPDLQFRFRKKRATDIAI